MENILITPLIGMGDTLMTTPALRLLKTRCPDARITCCTISKSIEELLRHNPHIDSLCYYPLKNAGFLRGTAYILKKFAGKYSTSLTFYPANRHSYNLFALMSLAPRRIGHTYLHCNFSQLNWLKNRTIKEDPQAHCVEENVRLLKFFGIDCDRDAIGPMEIYLTDAEKEKALGMRRRLPQEALIGVHAGTSTFKRHGLRRWPKEHFVKLINRFPDYHFVLFGADEDASANAFIKSTVVNGNHVTIMEKLPIRETAALIGLCDAFVTNDSGLMHIAAAMDRPTMVFLGPTNPAFIYPWNVRRKVLRTGISCSPCFYYSPRPLRCVKHINFKCLRELTVEMAEEGLKELLRQ